MLLRGPNNESRDTRATPFLGLSLAVRRRACPRLLRTALLLLLTRPPSRAHKSRAACESRDARQGDSFPRTLPPRRARFTSYQRSNRLGSHRPLDCIDRPLEVLGCCPEVALRPWSQQSAYSPWLCGVATPRTAGRFVLVRYANLHEQNATHSRTATLSGAIPSRYFRVPKPLSGLLVHTSLSVQFHDFQALWALGRSYSSDSPRGPLHAFAPGDAQGFEGATPLTLCYHPYPLPGSSPDSCTVADYDNLRCLVSPSRTACRQSSRLLLVSRSRIASRRTLRPSCISGARFGRQIRKSQARRAPCQVMTPGRPFPNRTNSRTCCAPRLLLPAARTRYEVGVGD